MKLIVTSLAMCCLMALAAEPDTTKKDVKTGVHPTKEDLEKTAAIRKAIVADKELSVAAHNVKIFTENGKVTLRGAVKTEAEIKSVNEKAINLVGKENVVSELEVKN
ncbi:BON domain-containing protein [Oscillatoria laete-virens NRMC-F 0139]|nr:BON domain-containing protein [Oscillatoria laete-virens]MDL5051989.1 BON domain-containing protein [Oscillatoria laete-virens NRMC-F 0139]